MSSENPAETFRQEARELLEQLENALLDLEAQPGDRELVDSAFRALHTIKGSGAMFGFDRIARFTHEFESAFDRVRNGEAAVGRDLIAVALAAKDHIRALLEHPDSVPSHAGETILADLAAVIGGSVVQTSVGGGQALANGDIAKQSGRYRIGIRLPRDAMVSGNDPLRLLDELRELGDCTISASTDEIPLLDEIDPTACYTSWTVLLATDHPPSAIEDVFLFVLDEMQLSIECIEDVPQPESPDAALAGGLDTDVQRKADAQPQPRQEGGAARDDRKNDENIRVPARRLDELMERVGELVIMQTNLMQLAAANSNPQLTSVAEGIERLSAELRDTAMGMRMAPIGTLFGRFRRLVRDLSVELGKEVDLTVAGEETELDKTMIERLTDPLVHLIRNSIDHGLEPAAERISSGKPGRGRIHLEARHTGTEILVTVSDDGRGLDRDRIRTRAEQQGLLAADSKVTDAELFQLLFHPGFSTAREITAVSGRGVGMDVVKQTIEALRGSIDISTDPGKGTEIALRLPLTLAIIDGLLVRVGGNRYVLPLSAIEECVELSPADLLSQSSDFLNIRGTLVPYLRLRDLLNTRAPTEPYPKVVIVSAGGARVGLVVDHVIGQHQTVIKGLSKVHARIGTFSGATILGDGTVSLILDVAHLVAAGQANEEQPRAA